MKIVISSGHGKYIRGASGYPVPPQLDEVDEARRVVDRVAEMWQAAGVDVDVFHDNTSHDQGTNLNAIVNYHNSKTRDLDVSVHFNAYDGSAHGTEVLYVTQESLSDRVCDAICAAGGFTNRGAKYRSDLKFLNSTEMPAILLETCFCDNTSDSNKYNAEFEAICEAIAESISGQEIIDEPGEPDRPPVEWPPHWPPPDTEENKLEMVLRGYGDMLVTINGITYQIGNDPEHCPRAEMKLAWTPGMTVTINGQDYRAPTQPPEDEGVHHDIFATTFGGEADDEHSSYGPYDSDGNGPYLNDTDLYVAVPWAVDDAEVRERGIRVHYRPSSKSAVGKIMDKGPWMIDDNYPETNTRPLAETCCNNNTPLPRGPNAGKVPSNPAGIDLSPGMFAALEMEDNDIVDWEFVKPAIS